MRRLIIETGLFFLMALIIMILILKLSTRAMSEECFRTLYEESYGSVIYDTRTGVQYWRSEGYSNWGTLTVLVDEEGKPLIYNE